MTEGSFTAAELRAEEATKLPAFPVNIHQIRSAVQKILSEWKSLGFFHQYTDHSFSHVVDMLKTVDWVIPDETKNHMTPADWLMIVLSVYFHDLGLLISQDEYKNRSKNPDYKTFLANPVLPSEKHKEFVARLEQMPQEDADRLRYQEFVRYSHGKRVRAWLDGTILDDDNSSAAIRKILEDLLKPLDYTVRRDLALICESHTLASIDDTSVFKTSQPYGSSDETVNLQYCAVILRTVDLLQITRQRAPGVLYQLINPNDPISQVEWQKQGAVRTVRAALGRDREGHVSKSVQSDTIEVHATFKEPDGFFGLTSYLSYAEKEMNQSYAAIQKSSRDVVDPYNFPWRHIDTDFIDTEGFLTDSFEFELDQHKILDLLTGHTLYNDTTVVLRELTQNALDAVRLQADIDGVESEKRGVVEIIWNDAERSLTVLDNGTGMSQEVIESHLLKVGSSRYQDAKFKEKFPEFHSISRFGIGVLSAFMVSDDVEITTCSDDEEEARRIALRSVHGKYLIKLLDKVSNRDQLPMYPHGTAVKMILRPTARIGDVLRVAKSWLMFPRCAVRVKINNDDPIVIGYQSPKEAIQSYLASSSRRRSRYKREVEVKEFTKAGVTLAFAVAKDELFQDWSFVDVPRERELVADDEDPAPIATCVEGVAVEHSTPGFRAPVILAVANSIGKGAPRTNVARSALEETAEQRQMLQTIYELYARHISDEIKRLSASDSHSLSRAVGVAPYIATPLIGQSVPASKPILLSESMSRVPLVLIEDSNGRSNITISELSKSKEFWTVESPLYKSIEYFVKEAPSDITTSKILATLGNKSGTHPAGVTVCNLNSSGYVEENIKGSFEIAEIVASQEARQLELRWVKREGNPQWLSTVAVYEQIAQKDIKFWHVLREARERLRATRSTSGDRLNVPGPSIQARGLGVAGSFVSNRERYLAPGVPLAKLLFSMGTSGDLDEFRSLAANLLVIELLRSFRWSWDIFNEDLLDRAISQAGFEWLKNYMKDSQAFVQALQDTNSTIFDPFAWDRRDSAIESFAY
ncbi:MULTISPECIES: ATP-binding protein [unclassified Mesorhizobium]|uniref:HD domain-containing protein n=1 Tax=unclassified Mesorhizobium TaxID=325217 RepID=UPI0033362A96